MDNPNEKFLIMTNNLFTFNSHSCYCATDIENVRPGEIKKTLKVQSLSNQPIRFSFAPNKGMIRLARNGSINSERLLTQLISLPYNNTDKLFAFFEENGFLFPLDTTDYETIDINALFEIINRIKAIIFLMSEIETTQKDYEKILYWILYLQLRTPFQLSLQCFKGTPYSTCLHPLLPLIENASSIPEIDGTKEAYNSDTYSIEDSIYAPIFLLDIEKYNDTITGYDTTTPGSNQSPWYRNIVRLYRNATNQPPELRLMIDFLFHYQTKVGVIKSFDTEANIEYYDTDENIRRNYGVNFDNKMKSTLIKIAKMTIEKELDYNLSGVYPHYDTMTMSPSWQVSDLLSGIYFSIFYMKPGVELYRKCANPTCDRWFLVKTTSTTRKYCTSSCSNSNAQRNLRKRKLERGKK